MREAVRALVTARVLDVRRGDGTFVTSLRPELLLAGIGAAADLLQDGFTLELVQVRRILEPAATAMAASRITDATLDELGACLHRMSVAPSQDELVQFDEEFHQLVATRGGNADPGLDAERRVQPHDPGRVWRGVIEAGANGAHDLRSTPGSSPHCGPATRGLPRRPRCSTSRPPRPGSDRWCRPRSPRRRSTAVPRCLVIRDATAPRHIATGKSTKS